MLSNAYLLAKFRFDTAENERNFAKNWQLPYGSTGEARRLEARGAAPPGGRRDVVRERGEGEERKPRHVPDRRLARLGVRVTKIGIRWD